MKYVALIIALLFTPLAGAQSYVWNGCYWVPTQCGGGGCCQNWGCPPCNGGICYPPQRPRPQQPQDEPDEIRGPLPNYELRPTTPAPNPPLPPPPAVQTPPMPTIDPQAMKEQQAAIDELKKKQEATEKSLLQKQGCDCGPKWAEINAQITAITSEMAECKSAVTNLIGVVNQIKGRTPAPATLNFIGADGQVVATATITAGAETSVTLPPINFRVQDQRGAGYSTDYQPAQLGSYVTLPFGKATP